MPSGFHFKVITVQCLYPPPISLVLPPSSQTFLQSFKMVLSIGYPGFLSAIQSFSWILAAFLLNFSPVLVPIVRTLFCPVFAFIFASFRKPLHLFPVILSIYKGMRVYFILCLCSETKILSCVYM